MRCHTRIPFLLILSFLLTGCMPSAVGTYHTVERGQTLWRISEGYGVKLQELAELNNILDPTKIKAGQKLFIPGAFRPRKIEPYYKEQSRRVNRTTEVSSSTSRVRGLVFEKGRFIWPVKGVVVNEFGIKDEYRNNGLDIEAMGESPVLASDDGEVIYASTKLRGYGKTIIIKHEEGFTTVYANHKKNMVEIGDTVKKGEKIAILGNPGSGKNISHFEIRKNRKPRNPLFFLP
jgi:murein DD-endopeptidase MepM/ murein hydrolase activator NlpD